MHSKPIHAEFDGYIVYTVTHSVLNIFEVRPSLPGPDTAGWESVRLR